MDIYFPLFTDINDFLKRVIFPHEIKLAEVIPLFKKADPFDKTNCRPVSLISHVSKGFDRIISNQIIEYIKALLSKLLTRFCSNPNTQHLLLKLL